MSENEGRRRKAPNEGPDMDEGLDMGQGLEVNGPLSDGDLGEPIAELGGLEEDVSTGFLSRVLSKLQRRSLVGHFATMAWTASALAFFEFLGMVFSIFDHKKTSEKEGPSDG